MANKKITDATTATSVAGTDKVFLNQGGDLKQVDLNSAVANSQAVQTLNSNLGKYNVNQNKITNKIPEKKWTTIDNILSSELSNIYIIYVSCVLPANYIGAGLIRLYVNDNNIELGRTYVYAGDNVALKPLNIFAIWSQKMNISIQVYCDKEVTLEDSYVRKILGIK